MGGIGGAPGEAGTQLEAIGAGVCAKPEGGINSIVDARPKPSPCAMLVNFILRPSP